MASTLPDKLSEEKALGKPLAAFHTGVVLYLFFAFAMSLGGAVGSVLTTDSLLDLRRVRADPTVVKTALGSLVCLVGGIVMFWKRWRKPRIRVLLFEEGLACVSKKNIEVFYWRHINRVLRADHESSPGAFSEGIYHLILIHRDGRQITFDESLSRFREFCKMVKDQTLPHMLPPAVEAYLAGAIIGFGEVAVSREGIHRGGEMLSWDRVESARVVKGHLVVRAKGWKIKPFCKLAVSQVPNVHVLLALAEHARTHHS